jgi:hypothetical protein
MNEIRNENIKSVLLKAEAAICYESLQCLCRNRAAPNYKTIKFKLTSKPRVHL